MADLDSAARTILDRSAVPGLLLARDGTVLAVNPAFQNQTGHEAGNLTGRTWLRRLLPSSAERAHAYRLFRQARQGHGCTSRPWMVTGQHGESQPRVSILVPLDVERGLTLVWLPPPSPGHVACPRLVTSACLDDRAHLAAGLAHFLGNHLLGMKFEVHRALTAMETRHDLENSMNTLEATLQEGQALIDRIRILDRLAPLRDLTRNPSGLLLEVARAQAQERGLEPDAVFQDDRETEQDLEVKETPLRTAITEVVENALDARTRDQRIRLGAAIQNGRYVLRIDNEGTPLAPEVLAGARQPFFTTRLHRAAGLGLCIAERAMESLGGTIWFGPCPGGGVTVEISLPMESGEQAEGPMILVLDSELATRNQICAQLAQAGFRCRQEPVPLEDLLELFPDSRPDLILLGRASRGNEGAPLTAQLREAYPDIPLLLLGTSAHAAETPARTTPPATIVSRHDIEALIETIQTALDRSRRLRSSRRDTGA